MRPTNCNPFGSTNHPASFDRNACSLATACRLGNETSSPSPRPPMAAHAQYVPLSCAMHSMMDKPRPPLSTLVTKMRKKTIGHAFLCLAATPGSSPSRRRHLDQPKAWGRFGPGMVKLGRRQLRQMRASMNATEDDLSDRVLALHIALCRQRDFRVLRIAAGGTRNSCAASTVKARSLSMDSDKHERNLFNAWPAAGFPHAHLAPLSAAIFQRCMNQLRAK